MCVSNNIQMILNSCYSSLRLILKVVLSTYSQVYHLSEAGFFTMASLSTETKLKLPTLEPPTGTVSQQFQVADASVLLSDHFKLLGIILDKCLSFDKHVSNVCSISYFHIRALRHIRSFLDLESSKSIACAIVGSRLDYVNSCLSGVSYNIHRLPIVQNCPRCQTHPLCYTVSRSLHAYLHWLPIRQRVTFKLTGLVYGSLHETSPTYLSSLLHAYTPKRVLQSSSANLLVEPCLIT